MTFLFQYIFWHYSEGLRRQTRKTLLVVLGFFRFFSVWLLFKTLFSPWHKISESYGIGFDLTRYFYAVMGNLISRLIGAMVRAIVIITGLIITAIAGAYALLKIALWLLLPLLIPIAIVGGFLFIFFHI